MVFADESRRFSRRLGTPQPFETPYDAERRIRVRLLADVLPALHDPAVERVAVALGLPRLREAQEIAVRPAVAPLVLRDHARELFDRLIVVPAGDRVAHPATPAAERLRALDEVKKVRPDAADLRERRVGRDPGPVVALLRADREREDRRVVFRCESPVGDFDDTCDRAWAVERNAAPHGLGVLDRQLALGRVVRPTLAAENQEAVEPLPVVDGEREPAGRVRELLRVRDRLRLRWLLRAHVLGVIHGGPRVRYR